jgi:predicted Zn-dependent protease
MIDFLERVHGMTETDNSFMGKIMATHPAPMKRIGKLEEALA